MIKDYYEFLKINRNASQLQISDAFRNQSLKYHPKFNNSKDETLQKYHDEIAEAYQVLSDEKNKAFYDFYGYTKFKEGFTDKFGNKIAGFQPLTSSSSIFLNFCGKDGLYTDLNWSDCDFKNNLLEKNQRFSIRPNDVLIVKDLSLLEIYNGVSFDVEYATSVVSDDGITTKLVKKNRSN